MSPASDGIERDFAARDRHAVPRKNRFGLILVNFHVSKDGW